MAMRMSMRDGEFALNGYGKQKAYYGKCGVRRVGDVLILRSYNVRNFAAVYRGVMVRGYTGEYAESVTSRTHLAAFAEYARAAFHGVNGTGKNDRAAWRHMPYVDGYYSDDGTFAAAVRKTVDELLANESAA